MDSKQKNEQLRVAFDHLMIPKHRFDCVNLCLKETKQALREITAEAADLKRRIEELNKALLDAKVETMLVSNGAKNITAAKALIDHSVLYIDSNGKVAGLNEQIARLKTSDGYLFDDAKVTAYVLLPLRGGITPQAIADDESNGRTDK